MVGHYYSKGGKMIALFQPRNALVMALAFVVVLISVFGLGTGNAEKKSIELPLSMVSVDGTLYQKAEMVSGLAGLAINYASTQQAWKNAVTHALKGHEKAIVECIEWYHFHYSWSEAWLSGTEKVKFNGTALPSAAVSADLTKLLGAAALNGVSPCAGVTQEVLNKEFTGNSKKASYAPGQLRAVVVFARDTYMSKGQVIEKYLPLSMYLVFDWERWRCDHGYTSMLYPTPGFRTCP